MPPWHFFVFVVSDFDVPWPARILQILTTRNKTGFLIAFEFLPKVLNVRNLRVSKIASKVQPPQHVYLFLPQELENRNRY
jgi:hypothetical protein